MTRRAREPAYLGIVHRIFAGTVEVRFGGERSSAAARPKTTDFHQSGRSKSLAVARTWYGLLDAPIAMTTMISEDAPQLERARDLD